MALLIDREYYLRENRRLKKRLSTAKLQQQACAVKHWHEHLNEATIVDAILDRLAHNSIRVELKGPSLRDKGNKNALQTKKS